MKTHLEITQFFNDELDKLISNSSELSIQLNSQNLYEPLIYSLKQGGKRIRPILLILSTEACGGNINDALYPALGLEIFHNFTLVHDDIMDNASLRRGHPTVCNKWNNNAAILVGDTLFALAIKFITKTREELIKPVLSQFCTTSVQVCEGQQFDMDFEQVHNVSIDDYIKMVRLKTAVMFSSALKIGSIIANKSEVVQELLYNFGNSIGISFQLMDDYLDVYGNSAVFGKKIGGDILCCKKTYLYLKALELADYKTEEKLVNLYNSNSYEPDKKISSVISIFNELNIKEHALKQINYYKKKADEYLNRINISEEGKQVLNSYCSRLFFREE